MNKHKQIWETIADDIQEGILSGDYKPWERLVEADLAAKYSVSHTPVREALRYLSNLGFVEIVPRTMVRVKGLDKKEIEDLGAIQCVLEELAVLNAVPNLRERHFKEMEKSIARIEKHYNRKEYLEYEEANVRFHETIWKASDNNELIIMLENIYNRIHRFRAVTRRYPAKSKDLIDVHKEILKAAVQMDSKKAATLTRSHLEEFFQDVISFLEKDESL